MHPEPAKHEFRKRYYVFGRFRLDPDERQLRRNGETIPLPPRVFDLLLEMVRHPGEVLGKEELLKRVWPDAVVEEANLSVSISAIRKALGDDPHEHLFIQTLPRRGYRFISGVHIIDEPEFDAHLVEPGPAAVAVSSPVAAPEVVTAEPVTLQPLKRPLANLLAWCGVAVLCVIALAVAWRYFAPPRQPNLSPKVTPLTSYQGNECNPAFSPDGKQIAFAWTGEQGDNWDIYIRMVEGGNPLRLTSNPAFDLNPTWSPDGRTLAFYRQTQDEGGIYLTPVLGGAERKLADVFPNRFALVPHTLLHWSPCSNVLAVSDKQSAAEPFSISLLSSETGESRSLTSPPGSTIGDLSPAFSPDGQSVAFVRATSAVVEDLYVISLKGGEPRRLTFTNAGIYNLTWSSDGREIVFSARPGGNSNLWRIAVDGGKPELIAAAGYNTVDPNFSRQDDRLVYAQYTEDVNIWRIDLSAAGKPRPPPKRLISSTRIDSGPQYSPDGLRIAFASTRSGSFEIWTCDSSGENPIQLTSFRGPLAGSPRWSPDGRQIVFDSRPDGNADIFLINSEGGKPRRLTEDPAEDIVPSWSRDGRWIYFASTRSGTMQVWKLPAAGGEALQVTAQGGFEAFESPDGQWLYYTKNRGLPSIWRLPVAGGDESPVLDFHSSDYSRYWQIVSQGIYFATLEAGQTRIKFFSFASAKTLPVATPEKALAQGDIGLTVSPDGRWLLYSQLDEKVGDIMMLEGFR